MFHIGFLVGRTCLPRPVEEELMRKKHMISRLHGMTLCGHEATHQEFEKMKGLNPKHINCKRCLDAIRLRELIKDGEV